MHEASWSRAKVDADNRRTGGSIFRAERTSRLWARAALFEPLGWLELHPSTILRFRGGCGTHRAFCGSGADSRGTRRVFCGSGAGSSGHFEPSAAPGRARAAISSHLRLRARLERPYAANSSSSSQAGASGESSIASEPQARSKLYE